MDIYHVWCNLASAHDAKAFAADVESYLEHLQAHAGLAGFRITRRKLGLGPAGLGEFHIMMEFESLAALDESFAAAAAREDPVESLHRAVYSKVRDLTFALYRDFPDSD